MCATNKRPLHIAVLGLRGIPNVQGGIETHCQSLYPRLAAMGHKITLFARKGYVPDKLYDYKGVHVVPLWCFHKKNFEAILHSLLGIFRIALHKKSYDILHIHGIGPSIVIPIARIFGIPVVMTHHGPDYERQKWGTFAKKALRVGESTSARYATETIAVSEHIRDILKSNYGRDATYIPNGVDLPEILPLGKYLKQYNLKARQYMFAVGRLVPEKGFHDLLEAYERIDTDWKLVIAGDSDHEDEYSRGLKEKAKRNPRVVMTGFIKGEELQELFSNAGFFVLPSYHEGLPIALLEAMSYGLPILTSDIPANKELAVHGETFSVGNVNDLKYKLLSKLSQSYSPTMGRERIQREFNWDTIADRTEAIYSSLGLHRDLG